MNTLVLALLLTLPSTTTTLPTTAASAPTHYISTIGFENNTIKTLPEPTLTWPAVQHNLSQDFNDGHPAIDIFAKLGQPVVAMTDGVVTTVTTAGPYGNKIIISHPYLPDTTSTLYAHLATIDVQVGQTVVSGQQIGTIGVTGNSTGPHLHFEVRHGDAQVDPLSVFNSDPK